MVALFSYAKGHKGVNNQCGHCCSPGGGGVGSSEPAEELLWENSYAEGGGCRRHKGKPDR